MDSVQSSSAFPTQRVDKDGVRGACDDEVSEGMLVEIGQKPEGVRGSLCLAELGEVLCMRVAL
jgi:hypothetical protein